jgi:ATP phosphoribosyltransferase
MLRIAVPNKGSLSEPAAEMLLRRAIGVGATPRSSS